MPARTNQKKKQAAFTLGEALLCLAFVSMLAVVLVPLFASARRKSHDVSCTSNEKQIGLALLLYAQDCDGHFPFARSLGNNGSAWNFPGDTWENAVMPYCKSQEVFHCPDVSPFDKNRSEPSYRYNDLAAGVNTQDAKTFTQPPMTILLMDGDLTTNDVGHGWTPDQAPQPAIISRQGMCAAGQGATVKDAPTRHNGIAYYLFADGHVRFLFPDQVFFPPRASASRSHKDADGIAIGPDPGGGMTFAGTTYRATFHLR